VTDEKTEMTPEQEREGAVLAFKHLAFLLSTHPELPAATLQKYSWEREFTISLGSFSDKTEGAVRERMANVAKALRKSYFRVEKDMSGASFKLTVPLRDSGWNLVVSCDKAEVCERRVVGTEWVNEPEYENVKVGSRSVQKEIVEWDCSEPLLAAATS
jgi:hypothetical protein